MAMDTYGGLKTTVASYLNRSDLTSYIPDFVRLAERRISYGSDQPYPSVPLRVPAMQARSTGSSTGSISFPTRYIEPIRLMGSSGQRYWGIDYVPPNVFTEYAGNTGEPVVYTILNNAIETAGSSDYTLDYWQSFAALSADADTNWCLANAPDVYLFSALLESAPFIADIQMIQGWHGMYKSIVSSLNRVTTRGNALTVTAR
jgi:hypothetical protein